MLDQRPLGTHGITVAPRLCAIHHFSFASFIRDKRSGWGALTALNQITLSPDGEVGPNPIDGVDIIRLVRRGVLGTSGNLGQGLRCSAGEVEVISTSSGILLGDRNLARVDLEYVEIRLACARATSRPIRQVVSFPERKNLGDFIVLASGHAEDDTAAKLGLDARVVACRLNQSQTARWRIPQTSKVYVMLLAGDGSVNDCPLRPGDGLAIVDEDEVKISAWRRSEAILVEVGRSAGSIWF